jgi:hypothetical protein
LKRAVALFGSSIRILAGSYDLGEDETNHHQRDCSLEQGNDEGEKLNRYQVHVYGSATGAACTADVANYRRVGGDQDCSENVVDCHPLEHGPENVLFWLGERRSRGLVWIVFGYWCELPLKWRRMNFPVSRLSVWYL